MPFCRKCKYDLSGVPSADPCPECGCIYFQPTLREPTERTRWKTAITIAVFFISLFLFVYGAGPIYFVGNGSIKYNNLPFAIYILAYVICTISLALIPFWFLRQDRLMQSNQKRLTIETIYFAITIPIAAVVILIAYTIIGVSVL
ncbi:MAG: hypothetical protein R3B67_11775 [Phycisphaerales bacterium]